MSRFARNWLKVYRVHRATTPDSRPETAPTLSSSHGGHPYPPISAGAAGARWTGDSADGTSSSSLSVTSIIITEKREERWAGRCAV